MDPFEQLQKEIHDVFKTAIAAALKTALEQAHAPFVNLGGDARIVLDVLTYHAMHTQLALQVGVTEAMMLRDSNVTADELRMQRDKALDEGAQLVRTALETSSH